MFDAPSMILVEAIQLIIHIHWTLHICCDVELHGTCQLGAVASILHSKTIQLSVLIQHVMHLSSWYPTHSNVLVHQCVTEP